MKTLSKRTRVAVKSIWRALNSYRFDPLMRTMDLFSRFYPRACVAIRRFHRIGSTTLASVVSGRSAFSRILQQRLIKLIRRSQRCDTGSFFVSLSLSIESYALEMVSFNVIKCPIA